GAAGPAAGERADEGTVRRDVAPGPAVALGDGAGQQAFAPEIAPALERVGGRRVVVARPGRDALPREPLGALDDGALDLAHRSAPRATRVPQIPRGRNRTNAMKMSPTTSGQASMTRLSRSARIENGGAPTKGPQKVPAPP